VTIILAQSVVFPHPTHAACPATSVNQRLDPTIPSDPVVDEQTARGVQCYGMQILGKSAIKGLPKVFFSSSFRRWQPRVRRIFLISRFRILRYVPVLGLFFQLRLLARISSAQSVVRDFRKGDYDVHLAEEYKGTRLNAEVIRELERGLLTVVRELRWVGDAFAFRMLKYDRFALRTLSENYDPGHIDVESKGVKTLVKTCLQIVFSRWEHVIIHDITNFLRIGDLTMIHHGRKAVLEVKSSDATSPRTIRQWTRIESAVKALSERQILVNGKTVPVIYMDIRPKSHVKQIRSLIRTARRDGKATMQIGNYLGVSCFDWRSMTKKVAGIDDENILRESATTAQPAGTTDENRLALSNLDQFYAERGEFLRGQMPYTAFRLPTNDIMDLISGRIFLMSVLNLDALARTISGFGWDVELTPTEKLKFDRPSHDKVFMGPVYQSRPPMPPLMTLRRGRYSCTFTLDEIIRLMGEFLTLDTLMQVHEQVYRMTDPSGPQRIFIPHLRGEYLLWR